MKNSEADTQQSKLSNNTLPSIDRQPVTVTAQIRVKHSSSMEINNRKNSINTTISVYLILLSAAHYNNRVGKHKKQ